MIETINIEGEIMIRPADVYPYTLQRLESGELTDFQESTILNNLIAIEWIKPAIQRLSGRDRIVMYNHILNDMKNGSCPPDPMSWSAMYFNFSEVGLNTNEMRLAINASEKLAEEIQTILNIEKWN